MKLLLLVNCPRIVTIMLNHNRANAALLHHIEYIDCNIKIITQWLPNLPLGEGVNVGNAYLSTNPCYRTSTRSSLIKFGMCKIAALVNGY